MTEEITYFKKMINVFLKGGMRELNRAIDEEISKIKRP